MARPVCASSGTATNGWSHHALPVPTRSTRTRKLPPWTRHSRDSQREETPAFTPGRMSFMLRLTARKSVRARLLRSGPKRRCDRRRHDRLRGVPRRRQRTPRERGTTFTTVELDDELPDHADVVITGTDHADDFANVTTIVADSDDPGGRSTRRWPRFAVTAAGRSSASIRAASPVSPSSPARRSSPPFRCHWATPST